MVNRVSPVRKLLCLLFCHVGFVTYQIRIPDVLGVSINTHAWDGLRDFSERVPLDVP